MHDVAYVCCYVLLKSDIDIVGDIYIYIYIYNVYIYIYICAYVHVYVFTILVLCMYAIHDVWYTHGQHTDLTNSWESARSDEHPTDGQRYENSMCKH